MQLTTAQLQQAVQCPSTTAAQWVGPITGACLAFGITTPKRLAAFLAQVGHESLGLQKIVEGLNYSEERLREVCQAAKAGSRWASLLPRAPQLARNPIALGNAAYANRMGNGDEATGDGYRFRGRGPIQNTGRANYAGMRDTLRGRVVGVPDFEADPDQLADARWGAMAAAAFWDGRSLNQLADAGRFTEITQRVNGGQVGAADRLARYNRALKLLGG